VCESSCYLGPLLDYATDQCFCLWPYGPLVRTSCNDCPACLTLAYIPFCPTTCHVGSSVLRTLVDYLDCLHDYGDLSSRFGSERCNESSNRPNRQRPTALTLTGPIWTTIVLVAYDRCPVGPVRIEDNAPKISNLDVVHVD
jgi:hypothetical protein